MKLIQTYISDCPKCGFAMDAYDSPKGEVWHCCACDYEILFPRAAEHHMQADKACTCPRKANGKVLAYQPNCERHVHTPCC